ncbi:MAG: hypothetical protein Q8P41_23585 [Pseudomonadota bacterium]|nr:hypothetical protein [Pseudomonadota bacterium]
MGDPTAAAPPITAPLPAHRVFPSAAAAVAFVLEARPRIIGIGEVHATTGGPAGPTTLARFTNTLLPVLAPTTSDLVIETWRVDGTCGEQAEQVVAQVETETKRPEATKSELVLLVEAAVALQVRPHDLAISCAEYATLSDPGGEIAYDRLLRLLTGKLGDYAQRGLDTPDATIVLYGGAVHNDVFPKEGLVDYSYGAAARAKGGEAYVELDLYAPELVRGNATLVEPAWAPLLDLTGPDRALLYERGPGSWVLLLETLPG